MKLHSTLDTISKYNFDKLFSTGDPKFLIVGFDDRTEKPGAKYKFKDGEVEATKLSMFHEYAGVTGNRRLLNSYKRNIEMSIFAIQIDTINQILNLYYEYEFDQVFEALGELGLVYRKGDNVDKFVTKCIRKVENYTNRLNLLKVQEKKQSEIAAKRKGSDMHRDAIILSMNLELGYKINLRETTMLEWIKLEELAKEKSEAHGKN